MKIMINYDLISKIKEAKLGFSLQKCTKEVFIVTSIQTAIYTSLNVLGGKPIFENLLLNIPFWVIYDILVTKLRAKSYDQKIKSLALNKLIELSIMLRDINVNTNYELLSEAYVYDTKYKLKFDDRLLPYIKQDKYIMVPAISNGEEKEVSLVQEHVVGSREYSLSHSTPKKVLKLAPSSI